MAHKPDVYATAGIYDATLPPYRFGKDLQQLIADEELLRQKVESVYGDPSQQLNVLEVGAGTGRMSQILLPYAHQLTVTDKFPGMLDVLRQKIPNANVVQTNTRDIADEIHPARQFDFVGAYWTLSYPIGEYLETIEDDKIIPIPDLAKGVALAKRMIDSLVEYVRPQDGMFHAYFFDSESPEQKVVTKIWEQLAPDRSGRRSFTREIVASALGESAEARGYDFYETHHSGIAPFSSREEMISWFGICHAKGKRILTDTRLFMHETAELAEAHANSDGTVDLPVGMYEYTIKTKAK